MPPHQVMESWRAILGHVRPRAFKISLEDVRVFASGEAGFVTCMEIIDNDDNDGRWVGGWVGRLEGVSLPIMWSWLVGGMLF